MFKTIDEIKIGEWLVEKRIEKEESKNSQQEFIYSYRCLPSDSDTKIGMIWLYPEKELLKIAAFTRTGKYILDNLSTLLVDNNGPAVLYKLAELHAIGSDNIARALSILSVKKLIEANFKKYILQEMQVFNKKIDGSVTIKEFLYLYKNTLKLSPKIFENTMCAPTEIVEVGIDNKKNQISIIVTYNNTSKETYIADKLASIKIVADVLSGTISSREGFNKFAQQCRPNDNMVDFVMKNCRFLFEFIGQPYAEVKKRLIDENLQQKLENFVYALESINKLTTSKERKLNSLKDLAAICIMRHTNFFSDRKNKPLPEEVYESYPLLKKILG